MGVTRFLGTVLGAAALLVGAGCSAVDHAAGKGGGSPTPTSNGVADKPPAEILRSAQDALRNSGSVHLKGNGTAEGQVYALDVRIKGTRAGRGTFTIMHKTAYVATTGQPYPMYLSTTGKTPDETSALEFTEYDKPLEIKPPAPDLVVDLNK